MLWRNRAAHNHAGRGHPASDSDQLPTGLGVVCSQIMAAYRAHFVTHGDKIFSVDHYEAEDDEEARSHTAHVLRSGIGKGYEIWQDERLVHVETYK